MKPSSPDSQPTSAYRLEVDAADLEAFVACLALGTLEAIRSGAWSPEAGIWTLAPPIFRRPLERAGLPADLLDVLDRAGELSALGELAGRPAMIAELDRMIAALRARLRETASRPWRGAWLGPAASAPPQPPPNTD